MNNFVLIKQFFIGIGKVDGIFKVDKYVVMLGQEIMLYIDRNEGIKYVGVVVGYYLFSGKQYMLFLDILVDVVEEGWWNKLLYVLFLFFFKKILMGKESISMK